MVGSILLVDDNQLIIELEKEILRYTALDILTAADGHEALAQIKAKQPDIVIMDLEMPGMDGATCCAAIKSDVAFGNVPVVMVTSKGNEDKCNLAGCDYFLTKPLNRDVFLETIRKFIPDIDRREKRAEIKADCLLGIHDEAITCHLKNISIGGAFVVTDNFCLPNRVVQLDFRLPNGTAIICCARIAWVNRITGTHPKGFGAKFSLLTKDAISALNDFIKSTG